MQANIEPANTILNQMNKDLLFTYIYFQHKCRYTNNITFCNAITIQNNFLQEI